MPISQARSRLQIAISQLEAYAPGVAIIMALSGLSIVKDRSIADGIFVDSVEGNTVDYSVNPMLTVRFIGKELNQKGKDFVKENRLGTWADFRAAQGLPSDKVNLSYSNRMWSSMAILQTGTKNGVTTVVIGSADDEVREYIGSLYEKYGNFIRPTATEFNDLQLDAFNELTSFLRPLL